VLFEFTKGSESPVRCSPDVLDALQAVAGNGYRRDAK
jgi:hypothetical protein